MPNDTNGIYNSLTRIPPYNIDELLSRVNEYVRVDDDELATSGPSEERNEAMTNLITRRGKGKKSLVKSVMIVIKGSIQFSPRPSTKSCLISRTNHTLNGGG